MIDPSPPGIWCQVMTPMMVDTTDDELAATCARQDESPHARRLAEAAFHTLYDRHAKRLLAFLGGKVNMAALDDVHQDVWAKVWQGVSGFRGGNFRAWVHRSLATSSSTTAGSGGTNRLRTKPT